MNPRTRIQPQMTACRAGRSRMQAAIMRIQNQNIAIVPMSAVSAMENGICGLALVTSNFACNQKYMAVVAAVRIARRWTKYHCARDGVVCEPVMRDPAEVSRATSDAAR